MDINDNNTTSENHHFKTTNSSLAAYLYMLGYPIIDVINESWPTTFVFKKDNRLNEYRKLFQTAKAEGNLVLYYDAYRKIIRMTKQGKL